MRRSLQGLVLIASVHRLRAECANACSGNGDCGGHDQCSCYNGYQANDCSERTCWFGLAHVDSPKGDLNGDGYVNGPLTTVLTGSEVYPWGTTEQYPNADANEGHFYMECSNRGLCDRKIGVCECFDGYEGTACIRKACPEGCSGHGTCETIRELSEWKGYETRIDHTPIVAPLGAHNYDSAIEESYSYDLWDAEKSTGCRCDPGYYGADCSLRKCPYGVDPIIYAKMDGAIYQTAVVHIGSKGPRAGPIGGTFKIIFYDAFGEEYTTQAIDAQRSTTSPLKVREALQALPNNVINSKSTDTFWVSPHAVQVSMQSSVATEVEKNGGVGAGKKDDLGIGIGTRGAANQHGVEFTITFNTNPGLLKAIEIDTRQVTAPGQADFWTASQRVGQFSTRYSTMIDKITACVYGSLKLYPSNDMTGWTPAGSVIKIGGQELRVESVDQHVITLGEPYLGPSIVPALRPTSVFVTALNIGTSTLTITEPGTRHMVDALKPGGKLFVNGCPMVSNDYTVHGESLTLIIESDHDCQDDLFADSPVLYSMQALDGAVRLENEDEESGQDMYITPSDTCYETQQLALKRGSADAHVVEALLDNNGNQIFAQQWVFATKTFTINSIGATTIAAGTAVFVNGHGPFTVQTAIANVGTTMVLDGEGLDIAFPTGFTTGMFPIQKVVSDVNGIAAGTHTLALGGRRYAVSQVLAAGLTSATASAHFKLGDVFTSGLVKVCENCVTGVNSAGSAITLAADVTLAIGDIVFVGGYVSEELGVTISAAATNTNSLTTSPGCWDGVCGGIGTTFATLSSLTGTNRKHLYKKMNGFGYSGAYCVEDASAASFQYVSQCSNRGYCDTTTALCSCYAGYTDDNCAIQNAVTL